MTEPPREIEPSRTALSVSSSRTVEIGNLAKSLRAEGKDVLSLSVGEPDFQTPEPVLRAAESAAREGKTGYTDSRGLPELREGISEKLRDQNNLRISPADIVVTCGAKHGVFLSLQALIDPGDDVLLPSPYWVSYPEMVRALGGNPVFLETGPRSDYRLTPDRLASAARDRPGSVLILNTPANPTGAVYPPDLLRDLARVARENRIVLLSDEVYEYFLYDGREHRSPASLSPEVAERTVTVSGFSKAYAMTGLRVGYVAGPSRIVEQVQKLQSHSTTHTSSISQHAALGALSVEETVLDGFREKFRRRRDLVVEGLREIPGVTLTEPAGAFYVFPDVSGVMSPEPGDHDEPASFQFARHLLEETGLAVVPGSAFGDDRCVRWSLGVSRERLEEAIDRFRTFVINDLPE